METRLELSELKIDMKILSQISLMICVIAMFTCEGDYSQKGKIARIELHYLNFWFMTLNPPFDCEDLMTASSSMIHSISIDDSDEIREWSKMLDSLSLEKWDMAVFTGDCRICCVLYSPENKIVRSIALWPTGIKMDENIYHQDSTMLRFIEPYFPSGYFTFSGHPFK
ncbi:MAG: hypothetical protein JSU85_10535 [Candidatus Zixiibacteriota bacterium]|nr:MAG: hypothetical protein JSU85_10535 [candidate division Zixibacteria bacterium]